MPVGGATLALDGRQILNRVNTGISEAIFLTNSGEGRSYSTMFEVRRPFRNHWFAQGSYIYGSRSRSWTARRARPRRTGATSSSRTIRALPRWPHRPTTSATASTSRARTRSRSSGASPPRCRPTTPASRAGRTRCGSSAISTATGAPAAAPTTCSTSRRQRAKWRSRAAPTGLHQLHQR